MIAGQGQGAKVDGPAFFSNKLDGEMAENMGDGGAGSQGLSSRRSNKRQKKRIRKNSSPSAQESGGACFSLFSCCKHSNQDQTAEARIERKKVAGENAR